MSVMNLWIPENAGNFLTCWGLKRRWGPSKTQLSWFCIYCGDSDYMFRPCLAIFRSQCWRLAQMRKNTIVCIQALYNAQRDLVITVHCKWHVTIWRVILGLWPRSARCVFSHLCKTSTLWPEDGQARPKHVVTIAAINTKSRQLCFGRTPLPSFNVRKHNRDDEPEDAEDLLNFQGVLCSMELGVSRLVMYRVRHKSVNNLLSHEWLVVRTWLA
jgi:hypothetical protein